MSAISMIAHCQERLWVGVGQLWVGVGKLWTGVVQLMWVMVGVVELWVGVVELWRMMVGVGQLLRGYSHTLFLTTTNRHSEADNHGICGERKYTLKYMHVYIFLNHIKPNNS